nr:hypothetical protein [Tanacetum cinerariifolium]
MVEWAEQEHFEYEETKVSCLKIDLSSMLIDKNRSKEESFGDRKVGVRDLRLKLQKKSANGSLSGCVRDLYEKLSGYSQSAVGAPAKAKPVSESSRPARRSVLAEAVVAETRNFSGPASKSKKASC